jgi:hypothetical protein
MQLISGGVMLKNVLLALMVALSAQLAWAAAKVESVVGNVQAIPLKGSAGPLAPNAVVDTGTTVTTGDGAQVVLRFDDGHVIALSEKSEFTIQSYRFEAAKPESGSIVFSILKGALRSVTGLIGKTKPDNFALRAPQATIGIRGTDFMVSLVNPLYAFVNQSSAPIFVQNGAGFLQIAPGSYASVVSATTAPTLVAAAAVPASVMATFSQLGAMPLGAGVSAVGGGASAGATGGTIGALGPAGIVGIAAGVAAVVSVTTSKDDNTTTTTVTHH